MSIKHSSELVKESINDAINEQREKRVIEEELRKKELKNKEEFNKKFIRIIINKLREIIKNNSTNPEKWFIDHPFDYIERETKLIPKKKRGPISPKNLGRIIDFILPQYISYFDEKMFIELLASAGYKCEIVEIKIKKFLLCPISEKYYRISPDMK